MFGNSGWDVVRTVYDTHHYFTLVHILWLAWEVRVMDISGDSSDSILVVDGGEKGNWCFAS